MVSYEQVPCSAASAAQHRPAGLDIDGACSHLLQSLCVGRGTARITCCGTAGGFGRLLRRWPAIVERAEILSLRGVELAHVCAFSR